MIQREFAILCFLLVFATTAKAALPVTDGLVMHLDASSISGISHGNPVSVWKDQSGAGNNATQPKAGVQPLYIANEAALSGFSVVRFDGSNDWMKLPSTTVNVGSFTMFAVAQYHHTNSNQYVVASQDSSEDNRIRFCIDIRAGDVPQFLWRAGNSRWTDITTNADTKVHVFGMTCNSNTGVLEGFLNGASVATTTNNSVENPIAFNLGSYNRGEKDFFSGDLAEFIVYNRELTTKEIAAVNDYLISKYSYVVSRDPRLVYPADGENIMWDEVRLEWIKPADYVPNYYRIYLDRDPAQVAKGIDGKVELKITYYPDPNYPSGDPTEYIIPALQQGTTYYWMVEAYKADESNYYPSAIWSFTSVVEVKIPLSFTPTKCTSFDSTIASDEDEIRGYLKTASYMSKETLFKINIKD